MSAKGYSPETRRLLDALSRRTVAYHPDLATALGSIPAAIILGQLLYWHGKQADKDGWIMKTAKELEDETAVTERQQENVRQILVSSGAVEFERRATPAMPFYRINHDRIIELYIEKEPREFPQKGETKFPPHKGDKFPRLGDTNTEITTEITSLEQRAAADAAARAAGIDKLPSQRIVKAKAKKLAAPDPFDLGDLEKLPAIAAHRRICGYQPITVEQAQHIVSRVNGTAETTWPADLLVWTQSTRRSDNQPYRLDAIEKQVQFHLDLEVRRRNGGGKKAAPMAADLYAELEKLADAPLDAIPAK